ncbi:hypothetical protein VP01_2393g1, partial [Puccinia sorghi]
LNTKDQVVVVRRLIRQVEHKRLDDGKIINSKSVKFLNFNTKTSNLPDYGELLVKSQNRSFENFQKTANEGEHPENFEEAIKEEGEDVNLPNDFQSAEEDSVTEDNDVADFLVPTPDEPVGRILRERALQVKPVKYSHFTKDPTFFRQAVSSRPIFWSNRQVKHAGGRSTTLLPALPSEVALYASASIGSALPTTTNISTPRPAQDTADQPKKAKKTSTTQKKYNNDDDNDDDIRGLRAPKTIKRRKKENLKGERTRRDGEMERTVRLQTNHSSSPHNKLSKTYKASSRYKSGMKQAAVTWCLVVKRGEVSHVNVHILCAVKVSWGATEGWFNKINIYVKQEWRADVTEKR